MNKFSSAYSEKLMREILRQTNADVTVATECEYLRLTCEQESELRAYAPSQLWHNGATRSQNKFAGLPLVLRGSILDHQYREMQRKHVHIDITKVERDEPS
ncbi:hypothetical protein [Xanthomonas phage XAJ2]|uniref:Uncharacterized protein n=1 Tax=Xanthomonas phage XAJ2 TaxID=1775249 RepID=A0A1I9L2J2_9CAUD|nr:hypothetical protein [Xanthomonas phage XAJ2]